MFRTPVPMFLAMIALTFWMWIKGINPAQWDLKQASQLNAAGVAHPSFSDTPLLFAGHDGYPEISVVLHNHQLIEKFVRSFLDKNLRQMSAPLLDAKAAASSEATVKPYGHKRTLRFKNPSDDNEKIPSHKG